MAKKYENVENVVKLLGEDKLGGLLKRLSSTEKTLADILKELSVLEAEKAERDAQAEAIRLAEEAERAKKVAEETAKAEQQAKAEAEKAEAQVAVEEKPKKKTTKKKAEVEEEPAPQVTEATQIQLNL